MSQPERNLQINYIELPATDIEATKRFYTEVFGWNFQDYGPDYTSFHDGYLAGGFTREASSTGADGTKTRGPLIVIYATSLEDVYEKVKAAGGRIVREIFGFPGGRRFHFADPNNNELPFDPVVFNYSFRSGAGVLEAVQSTFKMPEIFRSITSGLRGTARSISCGSYSCQAPR